MAHEKVIRAVNSWLEERARNYGLMWFSARSPNPKFWFTGRKGLGRCKSKINQSTSQFQCKLRVFKRTKKNKVERKRWPCFYPLSSEMQLALVEWIGLDKQTFPSNVLIQKPILIKSMFATVSWLCWGILLTHNHHPLFLFIAIRISVVNGHLMQICN